MSAPRLYWSTVNTIEEAKNSLDPLSLKLKAKIKKEALGYCSNRTIELDETGHNSLLVRARLFQARVVTLLTEWMFSGNDKFRTAALDYFRDMTKWQYWSWITMRAGNDKPDAVFDLSYGENSATLAIAYDMLNETLSASEKKLLVDLALKWSFASFLKTDKPVYKDWWFKHRRTNWNTVCAGGAGMLALVLKDDYPQICTKVLKRAEESIVPYFEYVKESSGGWSEGIGYWGYGMRYAFMYLLSYEKTFNKKHPLLCTESAARTIDFPLDFMPDGEACSFGDVNKYWLLPFHYAAAVRFKRPDTVETLDIIINKRPDIFFTPTEYWPSYAETLFLRPVNKVKSEKKRVTFKPIVRYKGMDWFTLKDKWPSPNLYFSIRGGTTEVNHGHMDLTSYHCVVKGEALINNTVPISYIDSTFSARRFELPETNPSLKNVVLINNLGVAKPSTVSSKVTEINGMPAITMDYAEAMGKTGEYDTVKKALRTFILINSDAALIVDSVDITHPGRFESRIHTYAKLSTNRNCALITGKREQLSICSASTEPVLSEKFTPLLTEPGYKLNTLRYISERLVKNMTLFTLLTTGKEKSSISVKTNKKGFTLDITRGKFKKIFNIPH